MEGADAGESWCPGAAAYLDAPPAAVLQDAGQLPSHRYSLLLGSGLASVLACQVAPFSGLLLEEAIWNKQLYLCRVYIFVFILIMAHLIILLSNN